MTDQPNAAASPTPPTYTTITRSNLITQLPNTPHEGEYELINGHLLVTDNLGNGSYAEVDHCYDLKAQQEYALKRFSKSGLKRKREFTEPKPDSNGRPVVITALDKVYTEIALMKQLQHPHITHLYAIYDDPNDDELFLQLEYCNGGQIMDWHTQQQCYRSTIYGNNIPEHILRQYVQQLLDAVAYLHHECLTVHRDLKPDNLLLADSGQTLKLADFSVCKVFDRSQHSESVGTINHSTHDAFLLHETHGTYHFFAPEMCTGDAFNAFAAEMWQLGVTLYVLAINGTMPFTVEDHDNPAAIFDAIQCSGYVVQPELAQHITPELQSLLQGLLQKDPHKRLTLQQVRQHPWFSIELKYEALSPSVSVDQVANGLTHAHLTSPPSTVSPSNQSTSRQSSHPFASNGSGHFGSHLQLKKVASQSHSRKTPRDLDLSADSDSDDDNYAADEDLPHNQRKLLTPQHQDRTLAGANNSAAGQASTLDRRRTKSCLIS